MKVLVTGASGQLGFDCVKELERRHIVVRGVNSKDFPLTDFAVMQQYLLDYKPDAVIHCAAYTAVDKDTAAKVQKMIDKLEDNDDVQNVYTNMKPVE